MRMMVGEVKHRKAEEAMGVLGVHARKSAKFLAKAIKSGLALFGKDKQKDVVIKNIEVNQGPTFKRWRPGSRGMAKKYEKRTAHLEITLENGK